MTDRAPTLPEVVEGPDLLLRRWRASDLEVLAAAVARNVEHLRPWMPWVALEPLSRIARQALLDGWQRDWERGGDAVLGAFRDGEVVGGCGLHRRRGPHALEIGYWVDVDHLGQGIGTEMARLLTTAALGIRAVRFVEIHHDKANVASGRIPARLGFTLVGEAPDETTAPAEVGVDCTWRMRTIEMRTIDRC